MSKPLPSNARYDRSSSAIVVEFDDGSAFMVPARSLSEREIEEVLLRGGSGLHWETLNVDYEIGLLMEGKLGMPSFMAYSAENQGKCVCRPEKPPSSRWIGPVIVFLSNNLPGNRETGWEHDFVPAYQIACETLVALGQADVTPDGAVPRGHPALPSYLPRWDDLATAVVYLAAEIGSFTFLPPDSESSSEMREKGNDVLLEPIWGVGAARATVEVTSVLGALGLLNGNKWTAASETVLWRASPQQWRIDFKNDTRFLRAVDDACEHMPDGIRDEIDRLSQITEEAIAVHTSGGYVRDEVGPKPVMRLPPPTREQAISMIGRIRRTDFDELFYQFWRIDEGWLSPEEAARALEIFDDALAIAMRKAVAARLYPHLPHLAN